MVPVLRWLRKQYQKIRGIFYEGPDPPDRFYSLVIDFANRYPRATRAEWVAFAASYAGETYRSGYQRGYEWAERQKTQPDPDEIARALYPEADWNDSILLFDPYLIPEEEPEGIPVSEHLSRLGINRVA